MADTPFPNHPRPKILAPAGNPDSFLAAVAAGADAIYCGLKQYSARMEAANFTLEELAALSRMARERGIEVHLAFNTTLKPDEIPLARKLLGLVRSHIRPEGLIIQDLGLIPLARQAGLGERIHLSTLANVSFPQALAQLNNPWGIRRVVLPRELNIDEIRAMAQACPPGMDLEVFIHGALCYAVSGRCYWSSYMGGKSGLRGRCVQPCRRKYTAGKVKGRFFACLDLSLDVLVKVLGTIPQIGVWKIEGRKKGPHYVYHVVRAYRTLRDHGSDPQAKKEALNLLEYALGRPGSHYAFLPQRPYVPLDGAQPSGSGLLVGRTKGSPKTPYIQPRLALYPKDKLRIGYEDHPWHSIRRITRGVPAKGRLHLNLSAGKAPPKGTPVFLIDRRDPALDADIKSLAGQLKDIKPIPLPRLKPAVKPLPQPPKHRGPVEIAVLRQLPTTPSQRPLGLWLMDLDLEGIPRKLIPRTWWWLPPVVWPEEADRVESTIAGIIAQGGRQFVLNAPWQTAWFQPVKGLVRWAGPFCNVSNPAAIGVLKQMGFNGVILSPELGESDYRRLPGESPLPLGIVLKGNWPLGLSRISADTPRPEQPFISPQKETGWIRNYGSLQWVFPNWPVDLHPEQKRLARWGYQQLVELVEPIPPKVRMKARPGLWNWSIGLK
ncbi:MAG: peptidase U32 family protein [Desulfobacterales bacterium]